MAGDMYLRENVTPAAVPVNLSTSSTVSAPSHYEITVYDHQDAAITLSSLEQVCYPSCLEHINVFLYLSIAGIISNFGASVSTVSESSVILI